MKKILSALAICLVLLLCAGLALAQSDTGFDGVEYEYPTRTHATPEGEVEERLIPERSSKPTCTTNGIAVFECAWDNTLFHEVVLYAYGHSFERADFDPKTAPHTVIDCYTSRYPCQNPNCTAYLDLAADNHKWSSDDPANQYNWGKILEEPTCTTKGKAIDYCYVCGLERDKIREIDEIDHKWVIALDYEPYCIPVETAEKIADGMYHYECANCHAIRLDPEEAHDKDGYIKMDLATYKEKFKDADYDGHDWDGWIVEKEPNCKYKGEGVRFCMRCGEKQIKDLPTTPHNFVEKKTLLNCYEADFSKVCVNEVINPAGEKETCNTPDETYDAGIKAYVSHQFVEDKVYEEGRLPATCEKDGYVVYKCIHHDDDDLQQWHFDQRHGNFDPNMTEEAMHLAGFKKVVLPKLGHDWGEWVERYKIGDGDNNYAYWVRTCKRCGATEEKVTLYTPEQCAEGEHEWEAVGFDLATCEEPGMVWYKCFKCGAEDAEVTPAYGHDFEEELVKAATCTEPGKILKTCLVCDYIETEEIEPEGHKWVDQGDGTEKCSVCGEVKGEAWKDGLVKDDDGVWRYYKQGEFQADFTGIVNDLGGEFWVVKGVLASDATGLTLCPDGKWYFLESGRILRVSDVVSYDGQWFKVVNGELDLSANGLYDYSTGKFIFAAGRMIQTVDGLWQNMDGKWYYMSQGQVQYVSQVAGYNGRFFVIENGVLDTSYNGTIPYDGHTFEVANGQLAEVPID